MQIKVNGNFYEFFNDVTISTSLDAVASTFAFSGYYDPTNPVHRQLFQPLSYAKVEFFDNDRLISTGRITNHAPVSTSVKNLFLLSGYSLPGVLEDCTLPFTNYRSVESETSFGSSDVSKVSLESSGLTLEQIINKVCRPFGLKFIVYESVAAECAQVIPKSVCRPEQTAKDYICKLANQKNVVISHDIYGNLIAFRPRVKSAPKLFLNKQNTLSMNLSVDGQNMHSHITCIRQPEKAKADNDNDFANYDEGGGGSSLLDPDQVNADHVLKISSLDTVINPIVKVFRPLVDVLSAGTFYDTYRAAQNRRASELKSIKINFSLDHWESISVGAVVQVENDDIFINGKFNLILESTLISESSGSKVMSGSLVLPETFTGETPVNIFR